MKTKSAVTSAVGELSSNIEVGNADLDSKVTQSLLWRANRHMQENRPDAAISLLVAALLIDPGSPSLIRRIGICFSRQGRDDEATLCARGVLPDSINAHYLGSDSISQKVKPIKDCVGITTHQAYSSESIQLECPGRNYTDKRYPQFAYKQTEAGSSYVAEVKKGCFWFDGYNSVAFDCDKNIIDELTKGNEFATYNAASCVDPGKVSGTVCILDGRSSGIYYHWMLDILPKLGILEKAEIAMESIDYFLVNTKSKYQIESLALLGIGEERLLQIGGNQYLTADTVLVPYLKNDLGDRVYRGLGIGLASWIPQYLKRKFCSNEAEESVRIFITRSTEGSRSIHREEDFIDLLDQYGFTCVEFETMTIVEQASLMARAEMVVAVHGAGLTNLSYCKPGTRVVEIFGDYIVPCYWALSSIVKLDYSQFMADSIDSSASADNGDPVSLLREKQISIDLAAFEEYLNDVLASDGPL